MVFLADRLRKAADAEWRPLVLMGSEIPFPFELSPSGIDVPGIPASADQGLAMMESWGVPSRLASLAGFDGCHQGYVTDLAREWLATLGPQELDDVAVFACGPTPMLAATAALAADFSLAERTSLRISIDNITLIVCLSVGYCFGERYRWALCQ